MLLTSSPTGLARLFRLVGLVAVVLASVHSVFDHPWVAVLAVLSWLGWAGWAVAPAYPHGAERICLSAMGIGGGFTSAQSTGSMITALASACLAIALLSEPFWFGFAVAGVTVVGMCVSAVLDGAGMRALVGILMSAVVVGLMGWNRRQTRISAEQNRLLLEQSRIIRVERDRAAAMAERGRIARDIHDVLAHTLGGLVLQLDAADALLEAGAVDEAAERVKASHALAVSGLADARGVVGALRSDGFDLGGELRRLAEEHRGAGGVVEIVSGADPVRASEQVEVAVARVVQEALTNARKHAPGQTVTLALGGGEQDLELTVSNELSARSGVLGGSGSGAGLLGMRERIAAVGGTVSAGKEAGRWTVRIRVPRR